MYEKPMYEKPMDMDHMKPAASGLRHLSPGQALLLPGAFIAGLLALGLLMRPAEVVSQSILGVGSLLLVWAIALYVAARRSGRTFFLEVMLFKHHWVQACTQAVIYSFWAWYVPEIRVYWPLVLV